MVQFSIIWLYVTLTVQLSDHFLQDLRNLALREFIL